MSARPSARWQGGFTLIELLTVVAVIAILAALLLPALSRAKGKAASTQCQNGMKQLGLAMMLLVDDSDGAFPTASATSALGAHPEDWVYWQSVTGPGGGMGMRDSRQGAIVPYLSGYNVKYFRCPVDNDALAREAAWKKDPSQEQYTYSYSLNAHSERGMASYISKDRSVIRKNRFSSIVNPSQKIMLAEEKGSARDGPGDAFINDGSWLPLGYPLTMRHQGKANVVFADSHVESVPREFADADHPENFDPQK